MIHYKSSTSQSAKIVPDLASRLAQGERVNVVVTFHNGARSTIDAVKSLRYGDRSTRNNAIVNALKENAETSQQGVVQTLSTRSGAGGDGFAYFKSYWTSNKIFIKEADLTTVNSIAEDPQVDRIRIARNSKLPAINSIDASGGGGLAKRQDEIYEYPYWNLDKMQLNETYGELGGSKGEGVIVGAIDSGAIVTHSALRDSYVGEYGWYDGVNGSLESYDHVGHGTLVLGIIVGPRSGLAPGAKWMVCQACVDRECHFEAIMNCIQFMSCPTLPDGSQQDCSKAPHVVNFSIAGERDGEPYDEDFLTMKELGIISVGAIGNDGYSCMTDESPGNKPYMIGVGAFTGNWELWGVSGKGPAPDGTIKPDFVAPGVHIVSADSTNEEGYTIAHGTSCSTPHVTAIVALLHVRNPEITFEEAYEFLKMGSNPNITLGYGQQVECSASLEVVPNNYFGWGWVSPFETIKAQSKAIAARM